MLVLTRKCQEKIKIGDDITITIVRVKGQSVRVGIEAPRELKVKRTELPPKTPTDNAPQGTASAAAPHATPEQPATDSPSESSEQRETYRPVSQPLKQFVPRTRREEVLCAN